LNTKIQKLIYYLIQVGEKNNIGSTNFSLFWIQVFKPVLFENRIFFWLTNLKVSAPNKLKFVLAIVRKLNYLLNFAS